MTAERGRGHGWSKRAWYETMRLRWVRKPVGDYPDRKYTGGWDALCTTQQRAFHGQSLDPLTGVRLRQCNPKLFNQITRAWGEKMGLWIIHGKRVMWQDMSSNVSAILSLERRTDLPSSQAHRWNAREHLLYRDWKGLRGLQIQISFRVPTLLKM